MKSLDKKITKVLVLDKINDSGINALINEGFQVDCCYGLNENQIIKLAHSYHIFVVRGSTHLTSKIITNAKNLSLIGRAGTGVDNISINTATKLGIAVINTPKANSNSVAELTIGLIINSLRKINLADSSMKQGKWEKGLFVGRELKKQVVGIIGYGNIGKRVTELLAPFGCKILVYTNHPKIIKQKNSKIKFVKFPFLLKNSDIISLHLPLTEKTKDLITKPCFNLMKNGVTIINTARGELIEEKSLLEALSTKKVNAVALDTYKDEPLPISHPFRSLPNVTLLPHLGAATKEAEDKTTDEICASIINIIKNGKFKNKVN